MALDPLKIETATRLLLEGLDVDLKDHNFFDTPQRVAKMYQEMFDPPELHIPVFDESFTDLVLVKGHEFYTMCPHHILPVRLRASVAYLPNGKVIGVSKLVRLIHDVNRQPLTQEKLTALIICRIRQATLGGSRGEAVLLRGAHGCMHCRGVRSLGSEMVTLKFGGEFESEPQLQDRFLNLVNH